MMNSEVAKKTDNWVVNKEWEVQYPDKTLAQKEDRNRWEGEIESKKKKQTNKEAREPYRETSKKRIENGGKVLGDVVLKATGIRF